MAFFDKAGIETGFLKMAVHIGSENEIARGFASCPVKQRGKTSMRRRLAIKVQSMAIKGPREFGVLFEPDRIGQFDEGQTKFGRHRVGFPKSFVAAEIGQAGIHTHSSTGGDEQRVSRADGFGGSMRDGCCGHAVDFKFRGEAVQCWSTCGARNSRWSAQTPMLRKFRKFVTSPAHSSS